MLCRWLVPRNAVTPQIGGRKRRVVARARPTGIDVIMIETETVTKKDETNDEKEEKTPEETVEPGDGDMGSSARPNNAMRDSLDSFHSFPRVRIERKVGGQLCYEVSV